MQASTPGISHMAGMDTCYLTRNCKYVPAQEHNQSAVMQKAMLKIIVSSLTTDSARQLCHQLIIVCEMS